MAIAQIPTDSGRPSFLDLPGEIRNEIYIWYLFTQHDKTSNTFKGLSSDQILSFAPARAHGRYTPFSSSAYVRDEDAREPDVRTHTLVLRYADPVICQLNRQIRAEALSLYIAKYLSIDMRQSKIGYKKQKAPKPQVGLRMLENWEHGLKEHQRKAIRRLEMQDNVQVFYDQNKTTETNVEVKRTVSRLISTPLHRRYYVIGYYARYAFMPAFQMSITRRGSSTLIIRTPLKLHDLQAEALQKFISQLAKGVAQRDPPEFDGDDLLAVVKFLRPTKEGRWRWWTHGESNSSWTSIRFEMKVGKQDLKSKDGRLAEPFGYVAAQVSIADVK